jgi:hypothetical protein
VAWRLSELYLEQGLQFYGPVIKKQIQEETLPMWYPEAARLLLSQAVRSRNCVSDSDPSIDPANGPRGAHELALRFIFLYWTIQRRNVWLWCSNGCWIEPCWCRFAAIETLLWCMFLLHPTVGLAWACRYLSSLGIVLYSTPSLPFPFLIRLHFYSEVRTNIPSSQLYSTIWPPYTVLPSRSIPHLSRPTMTSLVLAWVST